MNDVRHDDPKDGSAPSNAAAERAAPESCSAAQWDARVERSVERLPARVQRMVHWLLAPSRWVIRHLVGIALVLGGIFSILPVLGLWMLPLGLALLSQDYPGSKTYLERAAQWVERVVHRFKRRRGPSR